MDQNKNVSHVYYNINLLYQWGHLFYADQCLGVRFLRASDSFGIGSGPIFLDKLDCGLTDTRVLDCVPRSRQGLPECNHDRDVGVHCEGMSLGMCMNLMSTTAYQLRILSSENAVAFLKYTIGTHANSAP